ncbi:MAG: TetR family transcriptional regulator [Gammaproteobacteria bacterium]
MDRLIERLATRDSRRRAVPYPADHRRQIRAKIIESARRLFNRRGFESVSVKQIMAGAGLTHGQIVQAYLSRQHFDDIENSCPMVALPTDVRRSSRAVKSAFESVFHAMVGALELGGGHARKTNGGASARARPASRPRRSRNT